MIRLGGPAITLSLHKNFPLKGDMTDLYDLKTEN